MQFKFKRVRRKEESTIVPEFLYVAEVTFGEIKKILENKENIHFPYNIDKKIKEYERKHTPSNKIIGYIHTADLYSDLRTFIEYDYARENLEFDDSETKERFEFIEHKKQPIEMSTEYPKDLLYT